MKKRLMFQVLLCIAGMSQAMDKSNKQLSNKQVFLELPSAYVLRNILQEAGFNHFLEETRLDEELGDKRETPFAVTLIVELALCDYIKGLKVPAKKAEMREKTGKIIELILQDSPEALEDLKTRELFPKNRRITL